MPDPSAPDVTRLLVAWRGGDQGAFERLVPLVYRELHKLAHARLRGQLPGLTLHTTAIVHEAYVRLVGERNMPWQNRAHFYGVCAQAMRCILVDAARARLAQKRGGKVIRVPFNDAVVGSPAPGPDVLALDEALSELSRADPRKGKVVELRYFGGLTVEETAEVLEVSPETVMRDWKVAKLRLLAALRGREEP
ncbi:MAG: RNA polymerase subunit sigma-70 [Acidobacteria bacterium]|nr:MAG: RNA polymerase subunit sigma-70 [Acidobacteriota bacterium]